jgi:hypothetical protein
VDVEEEQDLEADEDDEHVGPEGVLKIGTRNEALNGKSYVSAVSLP